MGEVCSCAEERQDKPKGLIKFLSLEDLKAAEKDANQGVYVKIDCSVDYSDANNEIHSAYEFYKKCRMTDAIFFDL